MPNYNMQARSSVDGLLKSWNSPTPDFAATGFPGPGTAQHVAIAKFTQDNLLLTVGSGTTTGDRTEWDGAIWAKRRGWITPDIDLTGAVDATTTIRNVLATARNGACVHLPDGQIRVGTGLGAATLFDLDRGITLTGDERGHRMSSKVFPGALSGVLVNHYGTGKFMRLHQEATACNFEVYYPHQAVAGVSLSTPIPCDWTFEALGLGVSLYNISCANPYWFIRWQTNGGLCNNIWGYPLSRGLWAGRVADATRFNKIHFNPGAWAFEVTDATMGWVQDNCVAFQIDGVEELKFHQCFAFGVNIGWLFQDFDADGVYSALDMTDCGVDQAHNCIFVVSGLSQAGLRMSNISLIPTAASRTIGTPTAGNGIVMADNHTPAAILQRPTIYGSNVIIRGATGIGRAIWLTNTSHGIVKIQGGSFSDTGVGHYCLADSANTVLHLDGVMMVAGTTRTAGTGTITDVNHNFGSDFS